MTVHPYAAPVRWIGTGLFLAGFFPGAVWFLCARAADGRMSVPAVVLMLACVAFRAVLLPGVLLWMRHRGRSRVRFAPEGVTVHGSFFPAGTLTFRRFRFSLSLLAPDLCVPRLLVSGDGCRVVCYLSGWEQNRLFRRCGYPFTII